MAATLIIGVLTLTLLPPARTVASEILQLFRAEKFEAIRIDPQAIADFDPSQWGTFSFEPSQVSEVGTVEEAINKTGLNISEPGNLPPNISRFHIAASSGSKMSLKLDLKKFQAYLAKNNIGGIDLPDNLDGSTITAKIPPYAIMEYSRQVDDNQPDSSQPDLVVVQAGLPEVEVPSGIDFETVRQQLLKLPILPPDIREQLARIDDWKRTLPIPYPSNEVKSEKVIVANGKDGLYFHSTDDEKVLIWTAKDKAFGLVAPRGSLLSRADLFAIAKTL